jgi:hypothetical protein
MLEDSKEIQRKNVRKVVDQDNQFVICGNVFERKRGFGTKSR